MIIELKTQIALTAATAENIISEIKGQKRPIKNQSLQKSRARVLRWNKLAKETKEGDGGQNTQNFMCQGNYCHVELYIIKRDGNHWKRDFKAKSELPFNNNILIILCVEKEDYLESYCNSLR